MFTPLIVNSVYCIRCMHSRQWRNREQRVNKNLFVGSGTSIETLSNIRFFFDQLKQPDMAPPGLFVPASHDSTVLADTPTTEANDR